MAPKKSKIKHHVDVRSGADILSLHELLKKKKNNTIIVLIYADFCGHCTTFKNDVWSKLALMPNRNAGLLSIHHDQVENTPFARKTINGYPTVFQLKKGQTPEEAEEVKEIRNMEVMNTMAEGEQDPQEEEEEDRNEEIKEQAEMIDDLSERNSSPPLDPVAETQFNNGKKENIVSILNEATLNRTKPPSVPSLKGDVLNSQGPNSKSTEFKNELASKKLLKEKVGGSLYASLLEASKVVAPAAVLTGLAVLSKKKKKTKKSKKSKKSKRKTLRR